MDSEWDGSDFPWKRVVVGLAFVIVAALAGLTLMNTQVSKILSTVGASVDSRGGTVVEPGDPAAEQPGDGAGPGDGVAGAGGSGAGSVDPAAIALDVNRPDLLIIKTGEISIRAASIGPTLDAATNAIVGLGGYASGSERSGEGREAEASVTFRIPSDHWEAALAAVRGVGEAVLAEHTETADVTGDVVDLHARIQNLRATEAALEAIMTRAGTIDDVLEVQGRLTDVRGQIEQLEAKVGDLEERAALSTLTVHISLRPAPAVAQQEARFDPGHETEAATAQLVSILQSLATAGIWFGIVWLPVLIALAVVLAVAVVVARWIIRRMDRRVETLADAAGGPA